MGQRDEPSASRSRATVKSRAADLRSMEALSAYRAVPRLRLTADVILQPIAPAEAGAPQTTRSEPPLGLIV
jgi:hypothetical protein